MPMTWVKPTVLLCANGFFRSFNPSVPYLTPYLMGPQKNFTDTELVNQIYPVWTYSYICFLVPVFLMTDFLKYKPLVILEGLSLIGCYSLLLFGETVLMMQLMQAFFGLATASQVGYYSYIYSIVPERKYQKVTSYTRAIVLLGSFTGALLGQLLVSLADVDYFYLFVISFFNICIAFCISLFLPMPQNTLFFYVKSKETTKETEVLSEGFPDENDQNGARQLWKKVMLKLMRDLKSAYLNYTLLRWSVWWALSTCGYILVVNYVQNLWETIYPSDAHQSQVYNGAVESLAAVLGALGAFLVSFLKVNWSRWGEIAMGICFLVKSGLLTVMFFTTNIWASYAAFVAYKFLYNFAITVARFQLAVGLDTKRYALVFGANRFISLALSVTFTLIIIDEAGFGLDVSTQFIIYSVYFAVLALVFLSYGVHSLIKQSSQQKRQDTVIELDGDQ